jgi:TonB family protein
LHKPPSKDAGESLAYAAIILKERQPSRITGHTSRFIMPSDRNSIVAESYENGPFSMLPYRRPPWREFIFIMGVQAIAVFLLAWAGVLNLNVLPNPVRDYHFIRLVETPPPVNVEPAPVRQIAPARVARVETPAPEVLRLPPPVAQPKPRVEEAPAAPNLRVAAPKAVPLPPTAVVIPRQLVKTNTFSTGSSAAPTIAAAPKNVQTGGFGDPNGVPARETNGKPVNIAQSGSFDLPTGPGYGNGTGGVKGARGVVASAGFGSGTATGDGSGKVNTSRGNGAVQKSGFGDAAAVSPSQLRPKAADESTAKLIPAEVISKPTPAYTAEARNLRIEGEVVLEVVFEASGRLRILRVVQSLGHGLDEAAVHAAEQIRFKPARRDGQPSDSTALVHIVFQLA